MAKKLTPICLMGLALELLWISSYAVGPFREHTAWFLALMLGAFALCLWSYAKIAISSQRVALLVIAFGLAFRLTLIPALPHQSEDIYRYIWDARLSANGMDPFRYPPDAPELEGFRDSRVYPLINSKPYITAYPPLSQILFRAGYTLFGENITAMKAIFSMLEFGSLLIAWHLLVLMRLPLEPLFLMAWNPFFIFEFSHSGHSDSAMVFFALLGFYLLFRQKNAWAFVSYGGAVLSKLHPALWFPWYLRKIGWRSVLPGLMLCAATAWLYFGFFSGIKYLASLRLYYRLFEFNAGVHYLIRYLGSALFHQAWNKVIGPYLIIALLLVLMAIWWKFPVRNVRDLMHAGFWIMTADLCLSTTVHPWYLSWAALALPFFPYAFMVYWTGAVFLSYLAYSYHPVHESSWVLLIEYLPMYALMGWELLHGGPALDRLLRRKRGMNLEDRKDL